MKSRVEVPCETGKLRLDGQWDPRQILPKEQTCWIASATSLSSSLRGGSQETPSPASALLAGLGRAFRAGVPDRIQQIFDLGDGFIP
jgi:hypothetical protein